MFRGTARILGDQKGVNVFKKFLAVFSLLIVLLSGAAFAQAPEFLPPLLEAFPFLELILTAGAVIAAGAIVSPATEWVKVRLKNKFGDLHNGVTHLINAAFSLLFAFLFLSDGRWADDPALGGLNFPWNVLVFATAVFLRSGGWWDERHSEPPEEEEAPRG